VSHDAVIRIEHVSKTFRQFSERNQTLKSAVMRGRVSKHRDFAALTDITFDVHRGETFGLIGSNGSGKSTLLRCIARILTPNEGRITVTGRVGALLEVGSGFHAELTGRENVFLAGAIAGLSRKDVTRVLDEIVDFAGIGDFIDEPVKNYSSGMYVRLGFSTAVAVRPDILLADEILAVGDAEFQAKCLARIESMRASGTTIVLVTHDITKIEKFCGRAAWIDHGELKLVGSAETVAAAYSDSLGHTES
jgi:ABC-type polysaccharide/polyol phosphate transport system ATPase subunit